MTACSDYSDIRVLYSVRIFSLTEEDKRALISSERDGFELDFGATKDGSPLALLETTEDDGLRAIIDFLLARNQYRVRSNLFISIRSDSDTGMVSLPLMVLDIIGRGLVSSVDISYTII